MWCCGLVLVHFIDCRRNFLSQCSWPVPCSLKEHRVLLTTRGGKLLRGCHYCAVWILWDKQGECFRAVCAVAELEEESPIINWSLELGTRLDSRLYALWNRTAGDCLLDSVLQATWGIYDKDSVLRKALHDSLHDCSHWWVRAAQPHILGIVLLKAGQSPWARLGSLSRVLNQSAGGNLDALSSGMACDAQQMAFQTLKCFILVKHALSTVIAAGICVPAM